MNLNAPVAGPDEPGGFRLNSDFTAIAGTDRPWLYASGLTGEMTLGILGTQPRKYRLRLHFLEPQNLPKGGRVFDVLVNGKAALRRFDVVAAAGAPRRAVTKEIAEVGPCATVEISLRRVSGEPPLLCGFELLGE